jgi:glycosyltransferase involved in cell wall biosynthesis
MNISVCIATYNGEKYIQKQIESILPQLDFSDEIIISDDSSQDETLNIIASFKDSRIKVFPNQIYKNPALNFENAISKAKGEFIFLCDQDDIWHENKVSVMLKYLQNFTLVISDCKIINESDIVLSKSFFELRNSRKGIFKNLYRNSYIGCCMAFRKSLLNYILPFPKGIYMHDWWIGMVAEIYGNVYFASDKLMSYRRHQTNASPTGEREGYSWRIKIRHRVTLIKQIFSHSFQNN